MEPIGRVDCPYCGAEFDLVLDPTVESQDFVTDCENCCRPLHVEVEFEGGELVRLTAASE